MATRRTTRHSNKPRKSLNESSLCRLSIPRRPKDDIKYVCLERKCNTFFGRHRTHGLKISFTNKAEGVAYNIIEFRLINNYQFILIDIWRMNGIQYLQLISLDRLYKEDYFAAIPGHEQDLIDIGYFTKSFLKKHQIEDIAQRDITNGIIDNDRYLSPMLFDKTCHHRNNDCDCNSFKKTEKGIILATELNTYYPQLSPEYLFCVHSTNKEIEGRYNGWTYGPQLNKTGKFNDIGIKDLCIEKIRFCIKNKSTKYLKSEMLNDDDYPLDTRVNNVFLGRLEAMEQYKSLFMDNIIIAKCISYSYLRSLIHKTFTIKVDDGSIGTQQIQIFGSEKGLLMNGVYIDPYQMQYGVIHHAKLDGIVFLYDMESIEFELTPLWILQFLGINNIIKSNRDSSQTRLKNKNIKIKYNRESSSIYISNMQYFNVNRHFVNTEKKLAGNSIKIRIKKENQSYSIME